MASTSYTSSLRIGKNDPRLLTLSNVSSNITEEERLTDLTIAILKPKVGARLVLCRPSYRHSNERRPAKSVRRRPNLERVGCLVNNHLSKCPPTIVPATPDL